MEILYIILSAILATGVLGILITWGMNKLKPIIDKSDNKVDDSIYNIVRPLVDKYVKEGENKLKGMVDKKLKDV